MIVSINAGSIIKCRRKLLLCHNMLDEAKFEYKWQWAYQDRFKEKGLMALLGSGNSGGVLAPSHFTDAMLGGAFGYTVKTIFPEIAGKWP